MTEKLANTFQNCVVEKTRQQLMSLVQRANKCKYRFQVTNPCVTIRLRK